MLPSVHVLTAITAATRVNCSVRRFATIVLLAHFIPLDFVPHLEPSLLGGNYLSPRSFGFWWAALDLGAATIFTLFVFVNFPELRTFTAAGYVAGIAPDLLQTAINSGFAPDWFWVRFYDQVHETVHWWKVIPAKWAIPIGAINTLLAWTASAWFFFQYKYRTAPQPAIAAAS